MPSVPLYPQSARLDSDSASNAHNALPPLLQTPSGLAILELQGTINIPTTPSATATENLEQSLDDKPGKTIETELGKLMFPDYSDLDPDSTKWMKRVYLYAGHYQRMTGEVKKLAKPLAIIQRRPKPTTETNGGNDDNGKDELEIVEIVKYKIIFASRPEPVGFE
jgi:chromosome transmission fidelity protein 8